MNPLEQADFGHPLDSAVMERGLRELCSDLKFDLGGTHGLWHPRIENRMGVYYLDQHICGMDRGVVPEYKVWDTKKVVREIPWSEADREDAGIGYVEVLPTEPDYIDLYEKGLRGNDPIYFIRPSDRKLFKCKAQGYVTIRNRCVRVGWRHTLERILAFGVPGVTRDAVSKKLGVDMSLMPSGTREELIAALVEE